MSAQTKYGFATAKGVPGGIYDMYHYPVDSRVNEEGNGKLRFGVGVVTGSAPGSKIALPGAESTDAVFEGITVNGFTAQHDLDGKVFILNNAAVGVMRHGRIWARVSEGSEPVYGKPLHMVVEGDEAGFFATEGGIEVPGRFIGGVNNGVAPVELYGITSGAAPAPEASAPDVPGTPAGKDTQD